MTTPAADRRVWLITGATSGFGRSLAEEAVRRGDIVMGAGRSISRLDDLKVVYPDLLFPVMLDVTDTARDAEVVGETVQRFGRLDVLVNGAGRTQVGALEETTGAEMRFLFELHYFGPAALTKAALPHMRRQGGGWIVQFSSVGGQITAPGFGAYCATKFALEGLTQTLSQEVPGVHFLIVEPGAFRTGLFGKDAAYFSAPMPEYAETVGPTRSYVETGGGAQPGDPARAARAILTVMSSAKPPLRLVLGGDAIDRIRQRLGDLQNELSEWEELGRATSFDE
jgi:NAD(P)-dependent dehydrogenase (short-subunit alcohol dehydrogenase family)